MAQIPNKIPSAMQMMLKSMGIDPDAAFKKVDEIAQIMQSIDLRLREIAEKQTEILARIERIEHGKDRTDA